MKNEARSKYLDYMYVASIVYTTQHVTVPFHSPSLLKDDAHRSTKNEKHDHTFIQL